MGNVSCPECSRGVVQAPSYIADTATDSGREVLEPGTERIDAEAQQRVDQAVAAVQQGNVAKLAQYLSDGGDVEARDRAPPNGTLLCLAASSVLPAAPNMCRELLRAKASPLAADSVGCSAVHSAARMTSVSRSLFVLLDHLSASDRYFSPDTCVDGTGETVTGAARSHCSPNEAHLVAHASWTRRVIATHHELPQLRLYDSGFCRAVISQPIFGCTFELRAEQLRDSHHRKRVVADVRQGLREFAANNPDWENWSRSKAFIASLQDGFAWSTGSLDAVLDPLQSCFGGCEVEVTRAYCSDSPLRVALLDACAKGTTQEWLCGFGKLLQAALLLASSVGGGILPVHKGSCFRVLRCTDGALEKLKVEPSQAFQLSNCCAWPGVVPATKNASLALRAALALELNVFCIITPFSGAEAEPSHPVDVSGFSAMAHEEEVLFPAGQVFLRRRVESTTLGALCHRLGVADVSTDSSLVTVVELQALDPFFLMVEDLYSDTGPAEETEYFLQARLAAETVKRNALGKAKALNQLGLLCGSHSDYETALHHFDEARVIFTQQSLNKDPEAARVLCRLGNLHLLMGDHAKALPVFEKGLAVFEEILGVGHVSTCRACYNLAYAFHQKGEIDRAAELYLRCTPRLEAQLGQHPDTGNALWGIAEIREKQGDMQAAADSYRKATVIFAAVYGSMHPHVKATREAAERCSAV
mmetsp:Transcript_31576/g.69139  ORF Transcript_31576/g.69139 Transcript_31576/m.69139 type:complete len:701 (+) Transcript_31576:76-2178(+)